MDFGHGGGFRLGSVSRWRYAHHFIPMESNSTWRFAHEYDEHMIVPQAESSLEQSLPMEIALGSRHCGLLPAGWIPQGWNPQPGSSSVHRPPSFSLCSLASLLSAAVPHQV
ncbi:hypothetical protein Taro_054211, partial [Colocasia esculenta]|nr:hypothetical protein [Colocasia esculenta]